MRIVQRWKNISIAKKLYGVIGIMAILIIGELFTVWFAMNTLSAVRAFVGGEGLWSKAQKDAAFSLQRYAVTLDEKDFNAFLDHLKVCEGDHRARLELEKARPDLEIVRQGFIEGRIHPDDIDAMIKLLRRFHSIDYIQQAIVAWSGADDLLDKLKEEGMQYHKMLKAHSAKIQDIREIVASIRNLNLGLTVLEDQFSRVLGEGSRWLEQIVIALLSIAVLMVESIGLSLAFLTSRSISKGLLEISEVAKTIGHGGLDRRVHVKSRDEIGVVGASINRMGRMLQKSYSELETKVQERTGELAQAVRSRDEFLSITSHELKTPLTSLLLQIQIRKRQLKKSDSAFFTRENFERMLTSDESQMRRLAQLLDDMLDMSRIGAKKLELNKEKNDLCVLTRAIVERFSLNFHAAGCAVTIDAPSALIGEWDSMRIEQVVENLLTNAMKYAKEKPIHIRVWPENGLAKVSVRDQGIGIAEEDQLRIFLQFERAVTGYGYGGLGLGLYIANEIVKMHGGKLDVQSALGQGSTFTMSLPI